MITAREKQLPYSREAAVEKRKPHERTVERENVRIRAKIIGVVGIVITVLVLLIAQYSYYLALTLEADRVKGQLAEMEEEKKEMKMQVEKLSSLERIETIAREELGLQYPEQKQWVFLSSQER